MRKQLLIPLVALGVLSTAAYAQNAAPQAGAARQSAPMTDTDQMKPATPAKHHAAMHHRKKTHKKHMVKHRRTPAPKSDASESSGASDQK